MIQYVNELDVIFTEFLKATEKIHGIFFCNLWVSYSSYLNMD